MGNIIKSYWHSSLHQLVYNQLLSQIQPIKLLNFTLDIENERHQHIQIPIKNQNPISVVYLTNSKCVVQYPDYCLILDIFTKQYTQHKFPNRSNKRRILPYKDQSFCYRQDDHVIFVSKYLTTSKKKLKYLDQNMVLMHQTGSILTIRRSGEIVSIDFQYEKIKELNQYRRQRNNKQKTQQKRSKMELITYFGSIDEKNAIIIDIQKGWKNLIHFLDLVSWKQQIVYLFQPLRSDDLLFKIKPANFYMFNENQAIVGCHKESIKSIKIYHYNIELREFTELVHVTNAVNLRFITINQDNQIFVYTFTSKHQKQDSMINVVFFNYYNRKKVWEYKTPVNNLFKNESPLFYHKQNDILMRISPDLRHYLELKHINGRVKLVHVFASSKSKKLYFYLMKKSYLWERYGERLARQTLKVLLDQ